ncbi:hypothetical protein EBZ39_02825 [bacterium]|nr:hypothetical protein [bacterium]
MKIDTTIATMILASSNKWTVSRTGLVVHEELTFDEWASMAPAINEAARSVAFVIGDWLLYGEDHFRGQSRLPGFEDDKLGPKKVASDLYDEAIRLTGLDNQTLHAYVHVSRRVPTLLRNKDLSWEHHKIVAKLEQKEQAKWLNIAAQYQASDEPLTTRRLRRSISAGRVLEPAEIAIPESDKGQENHVPFVNRLVGWWSRMRERNWLASATDEQRAALKRDLAPVVSIYNEL